MSDKITTIELTSKPLKLWLALTSIASAISVIGLFISFGEPDMSTVRWFWAAVIAVAAHQICRAARWWQHG